MILYSQRDPKWGNHIYSATPPHTETVKSSGCGVTSAAMIVSNLTSEIVTPNTMADYSVANGFRIDGVGTAFGLFPAIATKYNLNCIQAGDIDQAIQCVTDEGMVVCSTDGGATGLFSTGGHIFIMSGANGEVLSFVDPDLYTGKYDMPYRKNKAKVAGNMVYVSKNNASPEITTYFLFSKKTENDNEEEDDMPKMIYNYIDDNMPAWARPTIQKLVDAGRLKGNENGELELDDTMLRVLVINDRTGVYGE